MQTMKNRINHHRRKKGMSLTDLTKRYQVERARQNFPRDVAFCRAAESGEEINVSEAKALARVLGVSVSDLYCLVR